MREALRRLERLEATNQGRKIGKITRVAFTGTPGEEPCGTECEGVMLHRAKDESVDAFEARTDATFPEVEDRIRFVLVLQAAPSRGGQRATVYSGRHVEGGSCDLTLKDSLTGLE